jgi:hypothetical protein
MWTWNRNGRSPEGRTMARVWKRKSDKGKPGTVWQLTYTDWRFVDHKWRAWMRSRSGYTDKRKTLALGADLEDRAKKRRDGWFLHREKRRVLEARRPIDEHVEEYEQALQGSIVPGLILFVPVLLWALFCWGALAGVKAVATGPEEIEEATGLFVRWVWPIGTVAILACSVHLKRVWIRRRGRVGAKVWAMTQCGRLEREWIRRRGRAGAKVWAMTQWGRGPSGVYNLPLMWESARSAIVPGLVLVGPAVLWTLVCGAGIAVVLTMVTTPKHAEQRAWLLGCGAWPIGLTIASGIGFRLMAARDRRRARTRFGLCPSCDYDISGIVGRCPECGREFKGPGVF